MSLRFGQEYVIPYAPDEPWREEYVTRSPEWESPASPPAAPQRPGVLTVMGGAFLLWLLWK